MSRLALLAAWVPWLAALALVGLDAAKPLVIDDTAYHAYARQIAAHPLDPYGFDIFWGNAPQPARDVLAPPLLTHWWAAAMTLFGDHVVAWKLSLLPFALLLAGASVSLARRFAPGFEVPTAVLVVLSPAVAPALNLMLDVPALALSLSALALFARAADGDDARLALMAGVVAGLALETKYSAAVGLAAMAFYGVVFGRRRLALVALAGAGAVFVGWEATVSARYGESHFLHHLFDKADATASTSGLGWLVGLLALIGPVAVAPALLCAYTTAGRSACLAIGALSMLVFTGLLFVPAEPDARFALIPELSSAPRELWVLSGLGAVVSGAAFGPWWSALRGSDPRGRFLAAWLLLELVGCIVLSPFLALRRVIGVATALVFLSIYGFSERAPLDGRRWASGIACAGATFGLVFALADLSDARARERAFGQVLVELRAANAPLESGGVWFTGHWGFQFLAERAGMRPLVAGESRVRAGDWLVSPSGVLAQRAEVPSWASTARVRVEAQSGFPYSTLPNAYGGAVAIRRQPERQMEILLRRIERDALAEDPTLR